MLRVVYRSNGGENLGGRSDGDGRRTALLSFLRAFEPVRPDAEVIFVNDGPVPADVRDLQSEVGRIVDLEGIGPREAHAYALRLPEILGWATTDLVWFAVDDHLYRENSLLDLVTAARELPGVDYFAMDGFAPAADDARRPVDVPSAVVSSVDGVPWERIGGATGSFGGRVRALREDRTILRPRKEPQSGRQRVVDTASIPLLMATGNLRANRPLLNRELVVATVRDLASRLGSRPASDTDWTQVAADVQDWAGRRGTDAGPENVVRMTAERPVDPTSRDSVAGLPRGRRAV